MESGWQPGITSVCFHVSNELKLIGKTLGEERSSVSTLNTFFGNVKLNVKFWSFLPTDIHPHTSHTVQDYSSEMLMFFIGREKNN